MVPLQIFYKKITFLVFVTCLMIGCRSNRNVEIPDAPPPYANFPAPMNFQNPQPIPQNSSGNPFAAPYNPNYPISNNSSSENEASVSSSSTNYSLLAEADLWALIQDPQGVELDWIKMKSGETVPLNYSGPITVTCSSGHKLKIFDNQKNLIETKANQSGISIVKLP